MNSHLTEVGGAPKASDVVPGMAHFANTGPEGKTCRECKFFAADGGPSWFAKTGMRGGTLKDQRCGRYREMMQGVWGPAVPHATSACKYFQQSEKPPSIKAK